MLKIRIVFEDCGTVGSDQRDFFRLDKETKTTVRTSRTDFRASQIEGLLAVLLGERPVSTNRTSWAREHWQTKDLRKRLQDLADGAVIELTEERCEMFFARKSKQTDYPSCNIDAYHSELRYGREFVEALKRLLPDVRTHGERVRIVAESCKGGGRYPSFIYEAARALDAEQVAKEMASGQRQRGDTAWKITPGYMGGNNFRPKEYVAIEANAKTYTMSSCGGPAVRLLRTGTIHLPVLPSDAAWIASKLSSGSATATFGEGGLAWVDAAPMGPEDFEIWDNPHGLRTVR